MGGQSELWGWVQMKNGDGGSPCLDDLFHIRMDDPKGEMALDGERGEAQGLNKWLYSCKTEGNAQCATEMDHSKQWTAKREKAESVVYRGKLVVWAITEI